MTSGRGSRELLPFVNRCVTGTSRFLVQKIADRPSEAGLREGGEGREVDDGKGG